MAVVYLVVRLHSLMDRTAVSGTAGTGSIPVGGARPHPLATYSALRLCVSPLEGVWSGATRRKSARGRGVWHYLRFACAQVRSGVVCFSTELAAQGFAHSTDLSQRKGTTGARTNNRSWRDVIWHYCLFFSWISLMSLSCFFVSLKTR